MQVSDEVNYGKLQITDYQDPRTKLSLLGAFHHSKEGFLEGIYKEKRGLGLLGENKEKHEKQPNGSSGATWQMIDVLKTRTHNELGGAPWQIIQPKNTQNIVPPPCE